MKWRFSILIILLIGFAHSLPLEDVEGNERIVVQEVITDSNRIFTASFEPEIVRRSGDLLSVRATPEIFAQLQKNPRYEIVGIDKQVGVFLQDTVGIVNASRVWNLSSTNTSINGSSRSVCVIDTGIDTSHNDLSSKILAQYCYCSGSEGAATDCCPDGTSEDNNATDNHGHGTHVSGIAAASGGIQGVSTGAGIVAVKVLNSSGVGFDSDLKLAIEWCSNDSQVAAYNISAISMSLGGGQYASESACVSADAFNVRSAINGAVAKNISIVVATGNTNAVYTDPVAGIASPACLANTTRVTASNKSDAFASFAFRNTNFSDVLVAPGAVINSTQLGGGYTTDSGTSMATPVVSGIIALLGQYLNLSSQVITPFEMVSLLNSTGVTLSDTGQSGGNFTRVDGYAAILEKDVDEPTIALVSPGANAVNVSSNQYFTCNASDWQLANGSFYLWNSTGDVFSTTVFNATDTFNASTHLVTNISLGSYSWNCEYVDVKGNRAFAGANHSLTVGGISVSLNSPANNTYTANETVTFTCDSYSEEGSNLENTTLYLWNDSSNLVFNTTDTITGIVNSSSFSYNFTLEGNYTWNCFAENNQSNNSFATNNYTIRYDNSSPTISTVSISATTNSATFSWNTSEATNTSINGSVTTSNTSYATNHTASFSSLSSSTTHSYTLTSCDRAGNCNNTSGSFTTQTIPSSSSGGGGSSGGSGGGGPSIHTITATEIVTGVSRTLAKNGQMKFTLGTAPHSLEVLDVLENAAAIVIRSEPIYVTLLIGEEKKLNLSTADHYDLLIRLENITGLRANITIQTITEKIKREEIAVIPNRSRGEIGILEEEEEENYGQEKRFEWFDGIIGIVLVILLLLLYRRMRKRSKHLHKAISTARKKKHPKKRGRISIRTLFGRRKKRKTKKGKRSHKR